LWNYYLPESDLGDGWKTLLYITILDIREKLFKDGRYHSPMYLKESTSKNYFQKGILRAIGFIIGVTLLLSFSIHNTTG
jgi:hypothetical protein